ncbi:MAG: InlB B-repeat-containing protein, partial [Culicoidibacterales bacterium]
SGYTFIAWNTAQDGSGSSWNFATNVMPAQNLILYAQWEQIVYDLSYDLNGGEGEEPPSTQKLAVNIKVLEPKAPKTNGHDFISWNTVKDGSGKTWNFTTDVMPPQNLTLYAQWTKLSYSVTYDINGGHTKVPVEGHILYGSKLPKPENPKRENYEFIGWLAVMATNTQALSTKESEIELWDFDKHTVPHYDIVLTAQWLQTAPTKIPPTTETNNPPIITTPPVKQPAVGTLPKTGQSNAAVITGVTPLLFGGIILLLKKKF